MAKIDIDIVKMAITQEISDEISKEKIDRIIAKAVEIAKGFEEPKAKAPKKQYVFVAYDKDKSISKLEHICTGAVFKIPESMSPQSVIDLVLEAKEDFNQSKVGRRLPVSTMPECVEFIPTKIFKNKGISVLNKKSDCYIIPSGF